MKIGILGGTFDPIHLGHLIMAEEARVILGLAKVLFVPAGQPWLKGDRAISPAQHRLEMVTRAIASNPFFGLSTVEIENLGPSYTVDTLALLQAQLGAEARLYFILGWDSLAELPRWKEPSRLVRMCQLVAVPRLGDTPDLASLEVAIPGISQSVITLEMDPIGISSSAIRQRLAQGLSIRYLVPEAVEGYIQQHRLYRE